MTAMQIDHTGHDHPATKAAREKCRVHRSLFPEPRYPEAQRAGGVFRDGDQLWQRLVLNADSVNRGDRLAGFVVVGHSTDARHDNHPAVRLDLIQGSRTGRLVVQADSELKVDRKFDPERAESFIDLDIDSTDAEFVLREVFDLTSQTMVIPKMLTFKGPGGTPIVRFTGPKKDLETVCRRYTPGGWEDLVLEIQPVEAIESQPAKPKYNFVPWQHKRVNDLLAAPDGKKWVPTPLLTDPGEPLPRTIFGQEVRDGWTLYLPGMGADWQRYVGRELMAALIEQYPHLLDLPEDFMP